MLECSIARLFKRYSEFLRSAQAYSLATSSYGKIFVDNASHQHARALSFLLRFGTDALWRHEECQICI